MINHCPPNRIVKPRNFSQLNSPLSYFSFRRAQQRFGVEGCHWKGVGAGALERVPGTNEEEKGGRRRGRGRLGGGGRGGLSHAGPPRGRRPGNWDGKGRGRRGREWNRNEKDVTAAQKRRALLCRGWFDNLKSSSWPFKTVPCFLLLSFLPAPPSRATPLSHPALFPPPPFCVRTTCIHWLACFFVFNFVTSLSLSSARIVCTLLIYCRPFHSPTGPHLCSVASGVPLFLSSCLSHFSQSPKPPPTPSRPPYYFYSLFRIDWSDRFQLRHSIGTVSIIS